MNTRKSVIAGSLLLCGLTLAATPALAETLLPGDAESGKQLHQAKCAGCHDTGVYTRNNRTVKSVEGLIGRVNGCNGQVKAGFSEEQINDVVAYLNENFYKF